MTRNWWIGTGVTLGLTVFVSVGGFAGSKAWDRWVSIRESVVVHDTNTRPRLAVVEQQSACGWCIYQCEETCKDNGIALDDCNCDRCKKVCP